MRGKWGWVGGWSLVLAACGGAPSRGSPELPTELVLLHTSDVHSRLWPFRDRISRTDAELGLGALGALAEVGGAARLATLLATERRQGAELWLDSGDLLEGAPVFGRYGGAVEVELWGALGVAAMALGNHELSLDGVELESLFSASRFPVLAANLQSRSSRAWLAQSTVVHAGGAAIALIGCGNPDSPPSLDAEHNAWGFSVVSSSASVQAAIDDLAPRTALVVVLSHLGLDADRELVRRTSGIDLVLGGHQHIVTLDPEWQEDCQPSELQQARGCSPRRVPIVHSGAYGRYLSRVELALTAESPHDLRVSDVRLVQRPVNDDVAPDAATAAFLEPYRAPPEPPIGYLPEPLPRSSPSGGDSPLGNFVTDAIQAETQADVVLLNSSGLRDELEAGPLLAADLELAFPFGEPWRLGWLSGRELWAGLLRAARKAPARDCQSALQVAGLWLRIDCGACERDQLDCLRAGRGEQALRDDESLLVALPQYLALPGADFESVGRSGTELGLSVTAALRRRIAAAPRLEAPLDCAGELQELSASRCAEAFGIGCPVSGVRARSACSGLPRVEGASDGRIEMLP